MDKSDRTASLMTPSKLAQVSRDKQPATPAAWLNQMASDAGHLHLRRLAELEGVLRSHARARHYAPVSADLEALAAALPGVDFGLLQPQGWLARATGKAESAAAEFSAQFAQADRAARQLGACAQALHQKHTVESAATDRALMEFDVELKAIDKIVEQGNRWLDDMRKQLRTRQTHVNDAFTSQQIADDSGRCDILAARLDLLRGAGAVAVRARDAARATGTMRATFLEMLKQAITTDVKSWQQQLASLGTQVGRNKAPAGSVEAAMESHQELQLCVRQAAADASALQASENELADCLVALKAQLEATA